jgi:hypothetical protein
LADPPKAIWQMAGPVAPYSSPLDSRSCGVFLRPADDDVADSLTEHKGIPGSEESEVRGAREDRMDELADRECHGTVSEPQEHSMRYTLIKAHNLRASVLLSEKPRQFHSSAARHHVFCG